MKGCPELSRSRGEELDINLSREDKMDIEYLAGVVRSEVQKVIQSMNQKRRGSCTLTDVTRIMQNYELASRGKLGQDVKAASSRSAGKQLRRVILK